MDDRLYFRQLLAGRDFERATCICESGDHRVMGERLDCVVEAHERQRIAQTPVLATHTLRIQHEKGASVHSESSAGGRTRHECRDLPAATLSQFFQGTHATTSRTRRSRRPVLSVMVKAPAAMA